jgi:hypothetical protein
MFGAWLHKVHALYMPTLTDPGVTVGDVQVPGTHSGLAGRSWNAMKCHNQLARHLPPASVVGCAPHCHPTRSRIVFFTSRNVLILFHRRTARQVSSKHDATDRWSFRSNERIYFGALVQLIQSRFVPSLHSTDVQTIREDEVMGRRRRASVAAKLCMMWNKVCLGA